MGVSIPNVTLGSFSRIKGKTTELASDGGKASYQQFQVGKASELNFKINNTFTNVKILDQNNKVVAQLNSKTEVADTSAKLGPGTYTAVITEANRTAKPRDFSLDISERQNVLMTAAGATFKGMAQPVAGADTGIQKHTVNVAQGGSFIANFSLPNARWAMTDKNGQVVASSDSKQETDFFNKPTFKIEPGEYQMMIIPSSKMEQPTPFHMSFVPRDTTVTATGGNQESGVSKILREREARLKQWASEAKPTTTSA
ncbi:hypothetical protein [Azospirillum agricola]|uniref:hypothetical protein n=1 Tax=Azospirillum agricola TaxID=1720247 RepID=UPI000A0F2437|nr:hypothetical protein [Azospirillum agricola]SMH54925.1 hypothetical protein SAMN02982994_3735 [Azospirillum lipoferum]